MSICEANLQEVLIGYCNLNKFATQAHLIFSDTDDETAISEKKCFNPSTTIVFEKCRIVGLSILESISTGALKYPTHYFRPMTKWNTLGSSSCSV